MVHYEKRKTWNNSVDLPTEQQVTFALLFIFVLT